jgi:hypothetical protein
MSATLTQVEKCEMMDKVKSVIDKILKTHDYFQNQS